MILFGVATIEKYCLALLQQKNIVWQELDIVWHFYNQKIWSGTVSLCLWSDCLRLSTLFNLNVQMGRTFQLTNSLHHPLLPLWSVICTNHLNNSCNPVPLYGPASSDAVLRIVLRLLTCVWPCISIS